MIEKEVTLSKSLYKFAKITVGKYVKNKFNVTYLGDGIFSKLKTSYLLLGNHTNFWDPVLIAYKVPDYIYFVSSDEYFRKPVLKKLFKKVGAIPKTKFLSDRATVKNIIKIKNKGGAIGIFPEGRRNWDGTTLEILYPTAKLVKNLKIPVIRALLQGATLSYPRWAKKARKGKLIVDYKQVLSPEGIQTLSVDEIHQVITKELAHNEYTWQRERMIPFKGKNLAEHLELFLFTCPHCQTIGKLKSKQDQFFCQHCGYQTTYNQYGFFETNLQSLYFDNPASWNLWQLDNLKQKIAKNQSAEPIIQDHQIILLKGQRLRPLKKIQIGQIALFENRIEFVSLLGEKFSFQLFKISGLNIQYNNKFEFYYEKELFRFSFKLNLNSAYKWVAAIQYLQNQPTYESEVTHGY